MMPISDRNELPFWSLVCIRYWNKMLILCVFNFDIETKCLSKVLFSFDIETKFWPFHLTDLTSKRIPPPDISYFVSISKSKRLVYSVLPMNVALTKCFMQTLSTRIDQKKRIFVFISNENEITKRFVHKKTKRWHP
jgi:hypothetical protein